MLMHNGRITKNKIGENLAPKKAREINRCILKIVTFRHK